MDKVMDCANRCNKKYDCRNSYKKDILNISKLVVGGDHGTNNGQSIIEKERCFKKLLDCWEDCGFRDLTYSLYEQ